MMMKNTYELNKLGSVKQNDKGFYIEIDPKYQKALTNIEGFSHLNVVWWANESDQADYRQVLVTKKPYTKGPDELGIFATRSPYRPNPICVSIVQVLGIDDNKIYVPYIDAFVDTPVVDIKPYHNCTDKLREVSVPNWCAHWPSSYEASATFDWSAEFEFES
jgi:tRNA-Thr(GGU) m(6)t(6)A37 methyltransferase TsaA